MKFHQLLRNRISSWRELEKQIEQLSTTKERGDVFEQFVFCYLGIKRNLYQIQCHYMAKNIPIELKKKYQLEKTDCGVDGLIILQDGKVASYQAKFRANREKPSYEELSKFWAEARRTDYHYTVANCYELSRLCAKHEKHLSVLVDEFDVLGQDFFGELYQFTNEKKRTKVFYSPDDYQKRMVVNTVNGFTKSNRGKLIAACGTGKTLTALWITEQLKTQSVLFIAPSLALIKQTLEAWAEQAHIPFGYLCVCSDKTVSTDVDDGDITISDLNVPVTTSPDEICRNLSQKRSGKFVVFSTYQSLDVLSQGLNKLSEFSFDLSIFDEAHRTAGTSESGLFAIALDDHNIPSKKRLFMTATERLVRPWIMKKAKEMNRVVFSMDDPRLYGPVFDRFSFGDAIQHKVISDYRIIVAGVKSKEIYNWINSNKLLVDVEKGSEEYLTYAQNIFRQVMLIKSMKELSIKKCITFHSTVKNAQAFINGVSASDLNFKVAVHKLWPELSELDIYLDHLNGAMSAGDRKERLDLFKSHNYGVISNARCLTEGVDVPIIDSIYFVNPKNSLIDIVQACGRALRKPRDRHDKIAYFIVPILLPDVDNPKEVINQVDFEMVHNLIQSLRDQDQRLEQWIDRINLSAIKGKTKKFTTDTDSPIVLSLPTEFDVKAFEENLYLRIAEVNGEPTRIGYKTIKYGKTERKSEFKRIFKTLGDYSIESYRDSLVIPTIQRFKNIGEEVSIDKIQVNHNNVSHTERLGLITKTTGGKFKLSPIGDQFFNKKVDFETLFRRQMLRYFSVINDEDGKRILFPYRASLKILLKTGSINFVEFVFGLYSMVDSSDEAINESVESIKYLRSHYPNLELINKSNQPKVLHELNAFFGTNFSDRDLWHKKTTIVNQYIYFRNHLAALDGIISVDDKAKVINLIIGKEKELEKMLEQDAKLETENNEDSLMRQYISSFLIFILFSMCK